jgi:16S rRNA (guanine527-N7)-methyltransferase
MTGNLEPSELLSRGLQMLSVPEPGRVQAVMEKYLDELERCNPRFGLVKFENRGELVTRHVLDSLAAWRVVRDAAAQQTGGVLDVGSGAGFPGIPLAAALPAIPFTLLERMARRVSFLKTCAVLLGLPLLRVVQADFTKAEGDYDVVTLRAVAPFERFLHDIDQSAVRWRTAVAYKGRVERAREELNDVQRSSYAGLEMQIVPLEHPFLDEERCVIVAAREESGKSNVDKPVRPGYDFSEGEPGS